MPKKKPKPTPTPETPVDRRGRAVRGLCRQGGRCWGPFKKIAGRYPMKKCKVCGQTS